MGEHVASDCRVCVANIECRRSRRMRCPPPPNEPNRSVDDRRLIHQPVGVDGLAAARSRHGSDTTLWCHSLPCRRFATSATRIPSPTKINPSINVNGEPFHRSLPLRGEPQSGDEFCNAKRRGGPRSGNVCVSKLAIERSEICGRSFGIKAYGSPIATCYHLSWIYYIIFFSVFQ